MSDNRFPEPQFLKEDISQERAVSETGFDILRNTFEVFSSNLKSERKLSGSLGIDSESLLIIDQCLNQSSRKSLNNELHQQGNGLKINMGEEDFYVELESEFEDVSPPKYTITLNVAKSNAEEDTLASLDYYKRIRLEIEMNCMDTAQMGSATNEYLTDPLAQITVLIDENGRALNARRTDNRVNYLILQDDYDDIDNLIFAGEIKINGLAKPAKIMREIEIAVYSEESVETDWDDISPEQELLLTKLRTASKFADFLFEDEYDIVDTLALENTLTEDEKDILFTLLSEYFEHARQEQGDVESIDNQSISTFLMYSLEIEDFGIFTYSYFPIFNLETGTLEASISLIPELNNSEIEHRNLDFTVHLPTEDSLGVVKLLYAQNATNVDGDILDYPEISFIDATFIIVPEEVTNNYNEKLQNAIAKFTGQNAFVVEKAVQINDILADPAPLESVKFTAEFEENHESETTTTSRELELGFTQNIKIDGVGYKVYQLKNL